MSIKFLPKEGIRFNRREFAGSFGDIGTDFPLIVSLILICGLDPASVLVMYGICQILTGVIYKLPMPVQPLKAVAVIAITQKLTGSVIYGGGLAIGFLMLILSLSGIITWIAKIVPLVVIRGIQFGLGIQLTTLALKEYVPSLGLNGYFLALTAFVLVICLIQNRKYPASLFVILLGIVYALLFKVNLINLGGSVKLALPTWHIPEGKDVLSGLVLLAIPQICLSIGNSILATRQLVSDLFPERKISVEKISLTYSLMNLVQPFFSGIPICHGSGGLAGHYTFGARTGGAVIIYGFMYLILGLFFSLGFKEIIELFPEPILGVILVFEGLALMKLVHEIKDKKDFMVSLMVGVMAAFLPYGYVVALVMGTGLYYLIKKSLVKF